MYSEFDNVKIVGMTACVPKNQVDNKDYSDIFGEDDVKKQIKVTGIQKRHVLDKENGQTLMDLNLVAVERLLDHVGWAAEDLEFVIYVSAYVYQAIPATAYYIMDHIHTSNKCMGYDVNLGCSSFINGVYMAASFLTKMYDGAKGIVVVSDSTTAGGNGYDKAVSMLSGDSATAIAVMNNNNSRLPFLQCFDGGRYNCLYRKDIEHNLIMDGMKVFEFTISDVAEAIKNYFDYYKIDIDKCDTFILHQAQKFIVQKVARFGGLPLNKVPTSYDLFGNTGGPSLPCTLCANIDNIAGEKEMIKVFFAGFGSGLSWGMVVADIDVSGICEMIYV